MACLKDPKNLLSSENPPDYLALKSFTSCDFKKFPRSASCVMSLCFKKIT